MGRNRKVNNTERVIAFLDFLRVNTDSDHVIKPEHIHAAFNSQGLSLGNPKTLHDFIIALADAINLDRDEHPLPEEDWRIIFDDYLSVYGSGDYEAAAQDRDFMQIKNLYYNPEFSYKDIDAIIEAINFSRTIEPKQAEKIIDTLENKFTSRFYKQGPKKICKVYEGHTTNRQILKDNLTTIQTAINDCVQIEYRFNGYTYDNDIAPMGDYVRRASPYYIVADNGKYYLLAANERYKETYIIRIDLMSDVTIPERGGKRKGIPSIKKKDVKYLPQSWEEDYPLTHYNMSYDAPEWITIKVFSKKDKDGSRIDPDYTFLHDAFGDNYKFVGEDKKDNDYDIVMVKCSPFGMVNFALQYSNKIEVMEPASVRREIKKRLKGLNEKYK